LLAVSVLIFSAHLLQPERSDIHTASSQKFRTGSASSVRILAGIPVLGRGIVRVHFPGACSRLSRGGVFQSETLRPRSSQLDRILACSSPRIRSFRILIGWHGGMLGASVHDIRRKLLSTVGADRCFARARDDIDMLIHELHARRGRSDTFEVGGRISRSTLRNGKRSGAKLGPTRSISRRSGSRNVGKREKSSFRLKNHLRSLFRPRGKTRATRAVERASAAAAGSQTGFETTPAVEEIFIPPSITPGDSSVPDTILSEEFPDEPSKPVRFRSRRRSIPTN
jgi:hypothetical protein